MKTLSKPLMPSPQTARAQPLQRAAVNSEPVNEVPPTVHEVLRSSGQPLGGITRTLMEEKFGQDFSHVKVHTGEKAAQSAQAVNALAYTVGENIVFAAGQHPTHNSLLTHELVHVIQQRKYQGQGTGSYEAAESEAEAMSQTLLQDGHSTPIREAVTAPSIQRQKDKNPLDDKAKAIIAKAKDTSVKPEDRAVDIVKSIIKTYYSSNEALVDSVAYDDKKAGSGVHVEEKISADNQKSKSTGTIYVGQDFLNGVTERHFARRVLQVGHELEHITQWRTGLAGGQNQAEREFLAFYHEALNPEKPGTGRMQHGTRVNLIDGALGYYYCLSEAKQKEYALKKQELVDRRATEVTSSGNEKSEAPTSCKKQGS